MSREMTYHDRLIECLVETFIEAGVMPTDILLSRAQDWFYDLLDDPNDWPRPIAEFAAMCVVDLERLHVERKIP